MNRALVALDLALPAMSGSIFNQLPFDSAATPQARGIRWRRHELGTGEIQITLTWAFLR
jgi:hypothetical protein